MLKKILLGFAGLIALLVIGGGLFVWIQVRAFDQSVAKVYDVPLPQVARSTDPLVLERGKHLAESLGACTTCHGANLGGGKVEDMGPLGKLQAPNITTGRGGLGAAYSDAELARLIKHGLRKDGTTTRFMPSRDWSWWPDDDVVALISYLRTQPSVDSDPPVFEIGAMIKVLDRLDMIPLDVARRIDHANLPRAPSPSPTREYGAFLSTMCEGCHGQHLSGGRIPGAPPEFPTPPNLTPHETGLKGWTFADFERVMRQGIRKNGQNLSSFMPIDMTRNYSDTEMRALWAYLESLPPTELGQR